MIEIDCCRRCPDLLEDWTSQHPYEPDFKYCGKLGKNAKIKKDGSEIFEDCPLIGKPINDGSGFTHYDTSGGRCGLCGSQTCSGRCFK